MAKVIQEIELGYPFIKDSFPMRLLMSEEQTHKHIVSYSQTAIFSFQFRMGRIGFGNTELQLLVPALQLFRDDNR